jgi:germacradienol/geosmin synthase
MTAKKLPFKLPNFYMPWPARMNPHLQGARVHSKGWAYEVGILRTDGKGVWSEKAFDRMDFAYFAANTHPDAPAHELDLITDWYVWGWFVDDYFAQAFEVGNNDLGQAKAYLSRLLSFMPKDLSTPTPEAENPAEYALFNLWPRTAPTMSEGWRQRFVDHIQIMSEANLRELFNKDENNERMLDPVEYIKIRRIISGMFWSADLVEHSLAAEIPPEIYNKRPIRVLNDIFADSVGLRNDIISYQRDVDEGRINNCVMVAQHFLNTELQEAVNFVNDLVTSRLYQFEHTMTVELPPLLDEYMIHGEARQRVLLYVKALRDWMAGDLEWETRPGGRYIPAESKQESALGSPKGLGTAAARLGLSSAAMGLRTRIYNYVPFQTVGEVALPEFYMPFSTGLHPNLEEGRRTSKQWAYEMGLIGIPGVSLWDEQRFDALDTALVCALIYPNATSDVYDLATKGLVWGFYLDHHFTERYLTTRDLVGGKVFLARLLAFVSDSLPTPIPANPSERGLVDLWQRMATSMSIETRQQMRCTMLKILEGWAWELNNQVYNRIPDPIDYIEIRINTFGFDFVMLSSQTHKTFPELYDTPLMQSLYKVAADVVCLGNDMISYRKEMESEGVLLNAVLVTQHFLDCDLAKAVEVVNNLITARIREFEYIVANELPAFCNDFDLDKNTREELFGYVELLQFMMCGWLKWYVQISYYQESEIKRNPNLRNLFNVPTSFSPSVTRISSLFNRTIGISAPETGSSSVQTSEPSLEPIVQNLLRGPNGLGTSATEIGSSGTVEETTATNAKPMTQELVSSLTKLGTATMQIRSLLGQQD